MTDGGSATHTVTYRGNALTATVTDEPAPGLHVYENPFELYVGAEYKWTLNEHRWTLVHHEGTVLATFRTRAEAVTAGEAIADLTDWTRNAMTCANSIGMPSGVTDLMTRLASLGGDGPRL